MKSDPTTHTPDLDFIHQLIDIIRQRKQVADQENSVSPSYTVSLFRDGINKMAQKVGEEAVELVIEAKDNNRELFKNEAADLIFHLLVLLEAKEVSLTEVVEVLKARHQ